MIKQNDCRLLPEIRSIGCFVRSCGAVAELKAGKTLSYRQINELWQWAKKSGNVDWKNDVKHSAPIITKAYSMLGMKGQFFEVATFKNGKMNYYGSVGEGLKSAEKWYIQKVKTDGPIGTHFRNVDYEGKLLFDPYEPEVIPQGIIYSIVYAFRSWENE